MKELKEKSGGRSKNRSPDWLRRRRPEPKSDLLLVGPAERWIGLGLASPLIVNQYIVLLATALIAIAISFTDMGAAMRWDFVGLQNFERMFADPAIGTIIINTILFTVFGLALDVGWGFVVALVTIRYMTQSVGTAFRLLWLLPRVTPSVVKALLWLWAFSPTDSGLLNALRGAIWGLEPVAWLQHYPLLINILLAGVVGSSFAMIVLSSAIQAIDRTYFHLAEIDGASEFSVIKDVITPFLRWPLTFLFVWEGLKLLTNFETILLLTNGGPMGRSEVWSLYAFHQAFTTQDFGYGSAISLMLLPVSILVMVVVWKTGRFEPFGSVRA